MLEDPPVPPKNSASKVEIDFPCHSLWEATFLSDHSRCEWIFRYNYKAFESIAVIAEPAKVKWLRTMKSRAEWQSRPVSWPIAPWHRLSCLSGIGSSLLKVQIVLHHFFTYNDHLNLMSVHTSLSDRPAWFARPKWLRVACGVQAAQRRRSPMTSMEKLLRPSWEVGVNKNPPTFQVHLFGNHHMWVSWNRGSIHKMDAL